MEEMEISGRILQHDMREWFTTVMNRLCADLALHLLAWYISKRNAPRTNTLSPICNTSLTLSLSLSLLCKLKACVYFAHICYSLH